MNPELAIEKHPMNQMGLGLPDFKPNLEVPLSVLGGALVLVVAGGLATKELVRPDRANAGVEVCAAPTNETPQAQDKVAKPGSDIMTYKPSVSNELCVGGDTRITTFAENIGQKTTNKVVYAVTGKANIINSLTSIKIDEREIPMIEEGQYPAVGEYCEWFRKDEKDRGNLATSTLRCNYGISQLGLSKNQKTKIEVALKPKVATTSGEVGGDEAVYQKAPYIEFSINDLPLSDNNFDNNVVRRDLVVRDEAGNSAVPVVSSRTCSPKPQIVTARRKDGKGFYISVKAQSGQKVSSIGNGASKDISRRQKAARVEVSIPKGAVLSKKIPRGMLKVNNRLFVDINKDITSKKYWRAFLPIKTKKSIEGIFIGPKGTVSNCAAVNVKNTFKF